MIEELIARIRKEAERKKPTVRTKPQSVASAQDIADWEFKHAVKLPGDYKAFLQEIGECLLHLNPGGPDYTCSVRLMPLREVDRYSWVVSSDKVEDICPSWYAFADHHSNNWICFDLATCQDEKVKVYDGCWEICNRPEDWEVLADSFSEFLARLLDNRNTSPMGGNGLSFWGDCDYRRE